MSELTLDPLSALNLENYGIGEIRSETIPAFTQTNLIERVATVLELSESLQVNQRTRLLTDLCAVLKKSVGT